MQPPSVVHTRLTDYAPENRLDVSFSKVTYIDIAPLVGLKPIREGDDIDTFSMSRARLPDTVFQKILLDLHDLSLQYGSIIQHRNEEARSRFLSAVRWPARH